MKISGYVWLEEIVDKLAWKHNVFPEEVEEVFHNMPHFRFVEKGNRQGEDLYAALGQTEGGRFLIVFFVLKTDGNALIVTAREMNDAERDKYEQR